MSHLRIPKYRRHRASGLAVVTLGGRDHYLGQHGTKESRALYKRLIAEWPASGHTTAGLCGGDSNPVTVDDVIAAYWRHLVA